MYCVGDFVIKVNCGICRIEDILHPDIPSIEKDRLYYLLIPQEDKKTKMYVPIDRTDKGLRKVMSSVEAWDIIEKIPKIEAAWITDDKQREQKYKEAIQSCKPESLVSIIKDMYARKQKRTAQGKKSTTIDERFFRLAEDNLYTELAFAIGKDKEEMRQLIADTIEKKKATN